MLSRGRYLKAYAHQQGAAMLLVVVMLLSGALVLSLVSYKGVFFQSKRVQNEIAARQLHWKAEGRLECALATVIDVSSTEPHLVSYTECDDANKIHITRQGFSNLYSVESVENGYRIAKVLRVPTVGAMGALSASSDIYFVGSYDFHPQPLEKMPNGEYSCVSVTYSNNLYLAPASSSAASTLNTKIPTSQEAFVNGVKCKAPEYTTSISSLTTISLQSENDGLDQSGDALASEALFFSDYSYQLNFDPFQELFGVPKSQLSVIKDRFKSISGGLCSTYLNGVPGRDPVNCACDKKIAQEIESGEKLIWVNGDCDIGNGSKIYTADQGQGQKGTIVVVQNGILSSTGSMPFNGVLYQLYTLPLSPSLNHWENFTGSLFVKNVYDDIAVVPVMYLTGSYVPDGLMVIDAPGQLAVFHGSVSFSYDKSKIENPLGQLLKPTWLKGSWNDF
ncbi:hypothetical protein [Vibrio aphrogenes]|uniref:hypothetical protein n=1 Tax=Vibrio aphrogenes TaxID=1891186 RepID=UPI000B358336|nr:hypothetical protein [Vibrio aphrogenes]